MNYDDIEIRNILFKYMLIGTKSNCNSSKGLLLG